MAKYYVGTAGWSYKDWVPSFYPKGQSKGFDWLQFYSSHFNFVEVNSTYYVYIDPRVASGWVNKIEDVPDFSFSIKLHQDFTHKRIFTEQNIKAVSQILKILSDSSRLSGLLVQFPFSFQFSENALNYINRLNDLFNQYNCFVEVRHGTWNKQKVYDIFNQMNVTLCTIDQPQIGNAISFDPIITNDKAYLRFHGRNSAAWFKNITKENQTYSEQSERYNYLYSPGEMLQIEQKITSIEHKVKEIFVIMNNHPQGNAVTNAKDFIEFLETKDTV